MKAFKFISGSLFMFGINWNCQDIFVYDALGTSKECYRQLTFDRLIKKKAGDL